MSEKSPQKQHEYLKSKNTRNFRAGQNYFMVPTIPPDKPDEIAIRIGLKIHTKGLK